MYDELELDLVGDRKTALFFIISDTDATFNFLVSMAYTQLFNLLCERADDKYGGRLPVHVRCLIDEAANIGQIPNLEKLMATIRSREISACLVLQAQSQLKALYKDNMDTIIGNCDSSLFLGGKEETTLKSWSALLGKETIDMYNTSVTKGTQESHGQNFQKLGKEPHVILWECDLGIHPNFQIISTDAAHVLRDDRADLSVFHQCHHALPIRSLKVRACVTVIYKELRIAEAVFLCISAEIGFLIHNAVTVAL